MFDFQKLVDDKGLEGALDILRPQIAELERRSDLERTTQAFEETGLDPTEVREVFESGEFELAADIANGEDDLEEAVEVARSLMSTGKFVSGRDIHKALDTYFEAHDEAEAAEEVE